MLKEYTVYRQIPTVYETKQSVWTQLYPLW